MEEKRAQNKIKEVERAIEQRSERQARYRELQLLNAEKFKEREERGKSQRKVSNPTYDYLGRRLRSYQFGGIHVMPRDLELDPPPHECYVCWREGHDHKDCPFWDIWKKQA